MTTITKTTGSPPFRKRDLVIVTLTTLVMAGSAAALIAHSLWFATATFSPFSNLSTDVPVAARASTPSQSMPSAKVVAAPVRSDTEGEDQELPESTGPRTLPHRTITPGSEPELVQANVLGNTILVVALIFAIAIVSPLAFAFCFFCLLRRHSERFGALIQINNPMTPSANSSAANYRNIAAVRQEPRPALALAPSEEQPKRQGGALFDRLFEETLELQMQIDGTGDNQQPAPEGTA